jgi:aminopeptidase N
MFRPALLQRAMNAARPTRTICRRPLPLMCAARAASQVIATKHGPSRLSAPALPAAFIRRLATSSTAPAASSQPQPVLLSAYQPCPHAIDRTELTFDIHSDHALVTNRMHLRLTPNQPLILDGSTTVTLRSVTWNQHELRPATGSKVLPGEYLVRSVDEADQKLELCPPASEPTDAATVTIVSSCNPFTNTALEGLYACGGAAAFAPKSDAAAAAAADPKPGGAAPATAAPLLVTQCEPHGFRRITYFLDRPDVQSQYRVRITAPLQSYPVLLSNGDCVACGAVTGAPDRHFTEWVDPHRKPSYLFALVAGDLSCVSDTFKTMPHAGFPSTSSIPCVTCRCMFDAPLTVLHLCLSDGRVVNLHIYVDKGDEAKAKHAMASLKRAMKWDETRFGLVCLCV